MKRYFVITYSKHIGIESSRKYHGKLLLFGEYTIIDGGIGFAMPVPHFYGRWEDGKNDPSLLPFYHHLAQLDGVNHDLLEKARESRPAFLSNIPVGYGMGSSGALSAAAYDLFFDRSSLDIIHLRSALAKVEDFFHGNSSGFDPLVSYLNKALLSAEGEISEVDPGVIPDRYFLYDSGRPRNTSKFIDIYKTKKSKPAFRQRLDELNALNEAAVKALLSEDTPDETMVDLSAWQLENFAEMIPPDIEKVWREGLRSKAFCMKLSGAGGGGYFILYKLKQKLPEEVQKAVIPVRPLP